MDAPSFSIAAVERDTGLSKDVLRIWERRYGFPAPQRDAKGERLYPAAQVERLRLIKRLMDQGYRPSKLVGMSDEALAAMPPRRSGPAVVQVVDGDSSLDDLVALVRGHDIRGYQQAMQQRLAREGLLHFVQDTVAPLTQLIGDAWEEGALEVFEEHLFTELTKRVLRQAMAALPGGAHGPRVLLTSMPDEPHALGLLMVEAILALEGAECVPLGTQTPLLEIVRATEAHGADIVALSFSGAFPARQVTALLRQLRAALPTAIGLWAGGSGVHRTPAIAGVVLIDALADVAPAVAAWRAGHPAGTAAPGG